MTPLPPPPPSTATTKSNIYSKLGFGISLGMLLLIWIVEIYVINSHSSARFNVMVLIVMCTFIIGTIGLVFSIIGLNAAIKHELPRGMAIAGIVCCCLFIPSFMLPAFFASSKTPIEHQEENISSDQRDMTENPVNNGSVVLKVDGYHQLECYNNTNGTDKKPTKLMISSVSTPHDLETWLKMNNLSNSSEFVITYDKKTNYSSVVELIDALDEIGITNYHTEQTE